MIRPFELNQEQRDRADREARALAPHRPWCGECKKKFDADELDDQGHCNKCALAIESRAKAAEKRAQQEAEAAANPEPPKPKKSRAKAGPSDRGANLKRYSHEDIIRLHTEEGLTSLAISKRLGCHRKTVVNCLTKHGLWNPVNEGRGGRPLSDWCGNGHDQSKWRRESPPGSGNWHCGKCKIERNARARKAATRKRFDNRLEQVPSPVPNARVHTYEIWIEGELRGAVQGSDAMLDLIDEKLRELSKKAGRFKE